MKKLSILALLLLSIVGFTACDSDRDDNPTLTVPSSFELLNPTIGSNAVDLENSSAVTLKAKEAPAYGFPTAVNYGAQISLTNDNWNDSASVYTSDNYGNSITYSLPASEIDKAIMVLGGYTDASQLPEGTMTVYVRMTAQLTGDTDGTSLVYSNAVPVTVLPYYMELSDADPVIWWLVGSCIADGKWTNSAAGRGVSALPMWTIPGEVYDAKTGEGKIEYVGYFPAGATFKIVAELGSWSYGMCGGNENGNNEYRNGGDDPGDIEVTTAGVYRIQVDTKAHTMTMSLYDGTVNNYGAIYTTGDFNDWSMTDADLMTASTTYDGAEQNHDWYKEMTFDGATTLKFNIGNWDTNWGGTTFPMGVGVQNGDNISVKEGSYIVIFNDITGHYYFVAK